MYCCPADLLLKLSTTMAVVHTPQSCAKLCGIDCTYSGLTQDGVCVGCPTTPGGCDVDDDPNGITVDSLVHTAKTRRDGCSHSSCLFCDGSTVGAIPIGAHVFFSANCFSYDPTTPALINVQYTVADPIIDATFVAHALSHVTIQVPRLPLHFKGTTSFKGRQYTITGQPPNTEVPCGIIASPYPPSATTLEFDAADTIFRVLNTHCGLVVASLKTTNAARNIAVKVNVDQIAVHPDNTTGHPVALAVANVGGVVNIHNQHNADHEAVLIMPSPYAPFLVVNRANPDLIELVNLTAILSVFGSYYEVEFYHDGQLYKEKHSTWVPTANRYLAITLLFLLSVAVSNGAF
jgi:hypothetical protein